MSATRRISKEYAEVTSTPPEGIRASLANDEDVHRWNIVMDGPEGTSFAGGKFSLLLTLPVDYPFKPPTLSFKTKIYHPNVTQDDKGSMCLSLLKADNWKPSSKISGVLLECQQLLREPNPDDAVAGDVAKVFTDSRSDWEKTAKEWTKKYAK